MKKRKLNSKNPMYNKDIKKKEWRKRKFIKEVKGVKMYFLWE